MIRIGTVVASVSRMAGGLFESVRALSQHTARADDVHVEVFSLRDRFTAEDAGDWRPLEPLALKGIGPERYGVAPGMVRELNRAKLDLVHLHGIWMYPSFAAMRWGKGGRPLVVSPHGMIDRWALQRSRWRKAIVGEIVDFRLLKRARAIRTLCTQETDAVRDLGLSTEIWQIPNGVQVPAWEATLAEEKRASDPGAPRERTMLFLGRIHPKKNLVGLLAGWQLFKSIGALEHRWRLQIVGWDQEGHEEILKREAARVGAPDVVFSGPAFGESRSRVFRDASAFILPSFSEGLPMAVLEAAAWRKPCLITSFCNIPSLVASGGAIHIGTHPEEIASGLRTLAELSEQERCAMGDKGREHVASRFSWPEIADEMIAAYRWALKGGSRPDCVVP